MVPPLSYTMKVGGINVPSYQSVIAMTLRQVIDTIKGIQLPGNRMPDLLVIRTIGTEMG